MGNQTFRLNTREWDRVLPAYRKVSKRSLAKVINKKMAWIVRRALWYTPKADYATMARELGQQLQSRTRVNRKTGKSTTSLTARKGKSWLSHTNSARTASAPLLALMINKRRGENGLPGLHGAAMAAEFRRIFGARARSIGFLKSGWLPALKSFRQFSGGGAGARGLPPMDKATRQTGQPKGGGQIATEKRPIAVIWNSASTKRDHKKALLKYGQPALQRAFAEELADTIKFIEGGALL